MWCSADHRSLPGGESLSRQHRTQTLESGRLPLGENSNHRRVCVCVSFRGRRKRRRWPRTGRWSRRRSCRRRTRRWSRHGHGTSKPAPATVNLLSCRRHAPLPSSHLFCWPRRRRRPPRRIARWTACQVRTRRPVHSMTGGAASKVFFPPVYQGQRERGRFTPPHLGAQSAVSNQAPNQRSRIIPGFRSSFFHSSGAGWHD